jgi:hypothetical protein
VQPKTNKPLPRSITPRRKVNLWIRFPSQHGKKIISINASAVHLITFCFILGTYKRFWKR